MVHIKKKKKKSALVEGVSSAREHTCTPPPSTSPGGRGARLLALPVAVLSVPVRLPDVYLALLAQPHHATVPHFSMTLYSWLSNPFLVSSAKSGVGKLPPTPHQWTTSGLFLFLELTPPSSPTFCLRLFSPKWHSWVVAAETIMQSLG